MKTLPVEIIWPAKILFSLHILFSMLGLSAQFVFAWFNRNPYEESPMNLSNFVIPFLITILLMLTGIVHLLWKIRSEKLVWIHLILVGMMEGIAVIWQIEFLQQALHRKQVIEVLPIATALVVITLLISSLLVNLIRKQYHENDSLHDADAKYDPPPERAVF